MLTQLVSYLATQCQCSFARHTPPKGEGLVKRYWPHCVPCQGYGQANQITVCVHVAKAYVLQGIEAAEDSSATNLGCSNLREKQKEAIISFVSGKDVLVHLPTGNESLFTTLCCHGYRAYFTFLWHNAINNVLPEPLPWVGCGVRD